MASMDLILSVTPQYLLLLVGYFDVRGVLQTSHLAGKQIVAVKAIYLAQYQWHSVHYGRNESSIGSLLPTQLLEKPTYGVDLQHLSS